MTMVAPAKDHPKKRIPQECSMSAAVFHVNLPFGSKNVRLVPLCELEVIALPVWAEPAGSVNPLRRYGKLLISVLPLAAISDATNQGGNQRCGNESQLTCGAINL
jgi:hypothetical protein